MMPVMTALRGERRGYAGAPGCQVHYRTRGEGVPLLLLHQALWSSIHYHKVISPMAAAGFRVIAPDMPGHGMSSPLPGTPAVEDYAETVVRLMDVLCIDRAAVAGHHGGALVAGRLAAAFPDRVIRAAFDTVPLFTAVERASLLALPAATAVIKPDGSHFAERWEGARRRADPAWSDATVHMAVTGFFMNGPWREQAMRAAFAYDFEADVGRIECPVLAVFGRSDPLYPHRDRLAAMRPDFRQDSFPHGAAMILEHPDQWVAKMVPFLAGRT